MRTNFLGQTDRQTDGRTDRKVKHYIPPLHGGKLKPIDMCNTRVILGSWLVGMSPNRNTCKIGDFLDVIFN